MPLLTFEYIQNNKADEYTDRVNQKALRDTMGMQDAVEQDSSYLELESAIFYMFENIDTSSLTDLQVNNILSYIK